MAMVAATSPRKTAGHGFAGDGPDSPQRWCNVFIHTRQLLKAGGTSKDKAIDTTEAVYRATLEERGQDPEEYAEILDLLREKGTP